MYKFKFADIGEGLHEGVVGEIYIKEGQDVKEGDSLFSVETDKVTSDIPSPATGVVKKVLMKLGNTIHVGDVIYHIDDGSEDVEDEEVNKEEAASVVGDIKVSNEMFSFDMFGKKPIQKEAIKKTTQNITSKIFDINSINAIGQGEKVDVVVIGGGPAGYKASSELSKNGLKVINIEKEAFGGTCVNIGCIPVKTFIETSKIVKAIKEASKYNVLIDQKSLSIDGKKLNERRWQISKSLSIGAKMVVKGSKAKAIKGEAKVIDKYNVEANGVVYTTKIIIIATGSIPSIIKLPGFDKGYKEGKVVDSTQVLNLSSFPKTITILSSKDKAGPTIDINFAQILADFGVKVTLIKESTAVANLFDSSMQKAALDSLKKAGVKVILNAKIEKFEKNAVVYSVNGETKTIKNQMTFAAIGREYLETGIEKSLSLNMTNKNFIDVDENFQTNVPNVFAIGDAIGKFMLAHEGFRHGYVVANNILKTPVKYKKNLIPRTSYVFPEIASVGYTEEQLKEKKVDYLKGEWLQKFVGKSVADGKTDGITKILIGKKHGEILGLHIANSSAIDAINEGVAFMELEATIEEVVNSVHPHPATSESIWDAALTVYQTYKKSK